MGEEGLRTNYFGILVSGVAEFEIMRREVEVVAPLVAEIGWSFNSGTF